MTLTATTDMAKLQELSARKYGDQAVFFLNSFWDQHQSDAEQVWKYAEGFSELDEKSGKEGCELDELNSHKFLERHGETLTVRELREVLREIDIDTNKNVSLAEYLIYRYKVNWSKLVNTIQGDQEAVNKALAMLDAAQRRLSESTEAQSAARIAENNARSALAEAERSEAAAKQAEAAAKAAEADARASEDAARAAEARAKDAQAQAAQAEAELREAEARVKQATDEVVAAKLKVDAAVADLHAQQQAYNDKLASLQARGADESQGLVSRNKAKNEYAQLKNEDPLPLQRAKITAEAEQRKHEKLSKAAFAEREKAAAAVKAAEQATAHATAEAQAAETAANKASSEARAAEAARARAEEARSAAEQRRQASEEATAQAVAARQAADAALEAAQVAFREAEDFLEEAKNTIPKGRLWWIDRELHEAKKYMPQSRGGISKN